MELVTDGETTTSNKGNPFDHRNFLVSYSIKLNDTISFYHYLEPWFLDGFKMMNREKFIFIGFNFKFDLHWYVKTGLALPNDFRIWDCQIADFILSGQENRYPSLNEVAAYYGLPSKIDKVKEYWDAGINTPDIPYDILKEYNDWDVELTHLVYKAQLADPRMTPAMHQLILLSGYDQMVLQEMEMAGIP